MQLKQENKTISRSGDFRETTFTIAANAQAFDILSKNLYSDPVTAIIRELSTNAADSHTDAGNTEPFDVQLPNTITPIFRIRDYGTGLSQEDVEGIYTTYFQSNRNESNDCTGGFGLGSKTPFALVDMFSLTSYFNGKKYEYSVFKGESGAPKLALLQANDTNEHNGIEIKIDVPQSNIWNFNEKALRVYNFFDICPNITGARLEFNNHIPKMSGNGWKLYDRGDNSPTRNRISVVMGNVCYQANCDNSDKLGAYAHLVLEMNIGDCTPTPSREELHYDDKTKDNVNKAMTMAMKEITEIIEDSIKNSKTTLEKIIASKAFYDILNLTYDETCIHIKNDEFTLKNLSLKYRSNRLDNMHDISRIFPSDGSKYKFIEDDIDGPLTQKHRKNIRHWIAGNKDFENYLCKITDYVKFVKTFGEITIKLSDIPDAPRQARTHNGNVIPRTFIKKLRNNCDRITEAWDGVEQKDVIAINSIAVKRVGYKAYWQGRSYDLTKIKHIAKSFGYENVYGLPEKRYKKLCETLGLNDLETEARKKMEYFAKTADKFTRAKVHFGCVVTPTKILNKMDGLSEVCTNLVILSKVKTINSAWSLMLEQFNITLPTAEDFQVIFNKKYPLVSQVNLCYASEDDVIEYIKLKS